MEYTLTQDAYDRACQAIRFFESQRAGTKREGTEPIGTPPTTCIVLVTSGPISGEVRTGDGSGSGSGSGGIVTLPENGLYSGLITYENPEVDDPQTWYTDEECRVVEINGAVLTLNKRYFGIVVAVRNGTALVAVQQGLSVRDTSSSGSGSGSGTRIRNGPVKLIYSCDVVTGELLVDVEFTFDDGSIGYSGPFIVPTICKDVIVDVNCDESGNVVGTTEKVRVIDCSCL